MLSSLSSHSVLIADAEPSICRVYEAKLTRDRRFHAVSATSADDALRAARDQPFDAIVWDTRLRDSTSALARVRALCPMAALLLTTTDDRPSVNADLATLDIADVLVKPFELASLPERVEAALSAGVTTTVARVDIARIGQQVSIFSPGGCCVTRVLDRSPDSFTVVGAPRVAAPSDFEPGRSVRVELRGADEVYTFRSVLLRPHVGPVSGWELRMPRAIRRRQPRPHDRCAVSVPVELAHAAALYPMARDEHEAADTAAAAAPSAEPAAATLTGTTLDVGLGGLTASCDRSMTIGAAVAFRLLAGTESAIIGSGIVLRCDPSAGCTLGEVRIGVQFTDLSPAMRQRLRAFLRHCA